MSVTVSSVVVGRPRADINLEFEKDFGHYRFHPRGRWVAERLWTEGSVEL